MKIVSVKLSASVKRFFVSRTRDFYLRHSIQIKQIHAGVNLYCAWMFALGSILNLFRESQTPVFAGQGNVWKQVLPNEACCCLRHNRDAFLFRPNIGALFSPHIQMHCWKTTQLSWICLGSKNGCKELQRQTFENVHCFGKFFSLNNPLFVSIVGPLWSEYVGEIKINFSPGFARAC